MKVLRTLFLVSASALTGGVIGAGWMYIWLMKLMSDHRTDRQRKLRKLGQYRYSEIWNEYH